MKRAEAIQFSMEIIGELHLTKYYEQNQMKLAMSNRDKPSSIKHEARRYFLIRSVLIVLLILMLTLLLLLTFI